MPVQARPAKSRWVLRCMSWVKPPPLARSTSSWRPTSERLLQVLKLNEHFIKTTLWIDARNLQWVNFKRWKYLSNQHVICSAGLLSHSEYANHRDPSIGMLSEYIFLHWQRPPDSNRHFVTNSGLK